MVDESRARGPDSVPGDAFPFPLGRETGCLSWLRNHSNYMATRGLLDYFRMAGVLLRGVLLNFLVLVPLLLSISLIVGHNYGPQLRALPSSDDLPLADLESLAAKLQDPRRPVDAWLAGRLSDRTRAALETATAQPEALRVALSADLRAVIDGDLVYEPARFDGVPLLLDIASKSPEALALTTADDEQSACTSRPIGFWSWINSSLSIASRSCLRSLNRELLEAAYEEIRPLGPESAGAAFESELLPPMPVPYTVTRAVLLLALLYVLLSPLVTVFGEISGHKQSLERPGSDSSVTFRDRFERTFGWALVCIVAFALFETLPGLVGAFHRFLVSPGLDWNAIFASMAGVSVAVLGGAGKLLAVLGGAKKKLAALLVGMLGLLAPLLVVLYVTEFLVYGEPLAWLEFLTWPVPLVLAGLLAVAMFVGLRRSSLTARECARLVGIAVLIVVVTVIVDAALEHVLPEDTALNLRGSNHYLVLLLAAELLLFCWLVVDVNNTSIHGLYRDRLASAYLVRVDDKGEVGIEEDVNLAELARYQAGSTAPCHLVNVTLNLQGSRDVSIRDRNSDFFVFSKRFIGGRRTGYCRTQTMEQVHPSMSLASAMAISAAAASPNMGQATNPAMVALMVLLNIRLGYWLPNPGLLEDRLRGTRSRGAARDPGAATGSPAGIGFAEVFQQELLDLQRRWDNVYADPSERAQRALHADGDGPTATPTTAHGLVGLGFSGGGIRSATINLGVAQVLHARGVFDHVDYLSTVSGGGYLGSSISTLMRGPPSRAGGAGEETGGCIDGKRYHAEIGGVVTLATGAMGEQVVTVAGGNAPERQREYRFSKLDPLRVAGGDVVEAGEALVARHDTLWDRFRWRVHPWALVRELLMKLDEKHRWVNLSDGGHIENLAGMELLRRRCRYIILGDGEADPALSFNGLATLVRYARIDLGVTIDIRPDAIRLQPDSGGLSGEHCAFATIAYPADEQTGRGPEQGYLLYLKSSVTGDEDEVIKEYRHRHPAFPHESTADQFFDENQFECYRALGQHIAEKALQEIALLEPEASSRMSFEAFASGMAARAKMNETLAQAASLDEAGRTWDTWLSAQETLDGFGLKLPEKTRAALAGRRARPVPGDDD